MKDEGSPDNCFYSILGLEKTCSSSEVRGAYKKLAKKWHPDKVNAKASASVSTDSAKSTEVAKTRFQAIQEAYSVLSDNNKRLMYDAGVYEDDDDQLEMGSFMGEMAAMMQCTKQEGTAPESMDDLKAMFSDIMDDYKPSSSNKRPNPSTRDSCGNSNDVSAPSTSKFVTTVSMDTFHFETKSLESGKQDTMEGEDAENFQELKQMFMNIVDPSFYASTCPGANSSGTNSIPSGNKESDQWTGGSMTFEELVAETLFPEDVSDASNLDRFSYGCTGAEVYREANDATSGRSSKRRKVSEEERTVCDASVESDSVGKIS